jgi:hypothetical protein
MGQCGRYLRKAGPAYQVPGSLIPVSGNLAPRYLAFVQLASIVLWLRTFGDTASYGSPTPFVLTGS